MGPPRGPRKPQSIAPRGVPTALRSNLCHLFYGSGASHDGPAKRASDAPRHRAWRRSRSPSISTVTPLLWERRKPRWARKAGAWAPTVPPLLWERRKPRSARPARAGLDPRNEYERAALPALLPTSLGGGSAELHPGTATGRRARLRCCGRLAARSRSGMEV